MSCRSCPSIPFVAPNLQHRSAAAWAELHAAGKYAWRQLMPPFTITAHKHTGGAATLAICACKCLTLSQQPHTAPGPCLPACQVFDECDIVDVVSAPAVLGVEALLAHVDNACAVRPYGYRCMHGAVVGLQEPMAGIHACMPEGPSVPSGGREAGCPSQLLRVCKGSPARVHELEFGA